MLKVLTFCVRARKYFSLIGAQVYISAVLNFMAMMIAYAFWGKIVAESKCMIVKE